MTMSTPNAEVSFWSKSGLCSAEYSYGTADMSTRMLVLGTYIKVDESHLVRYSLSYVYVNELFFVVSSTFKLTFSREE